MNSVIDTRYKSEEQKMREYIEARLNPLPYIPPFPESPPLIPPSPEFASMVIVCNSQSRDSVRSRLMDRYE
jgi:hypothetical protein